MKADPGSVLNWSGQMHMVLDVSCNRCLHWEIDVQFITPLGIPMDQVSCSPARIFVSPPTFHFFIYPSRFFPVLPYPHLCLHVEQQWLTDDFNINLYAYRVHLGSNKYRPYDVCFVNTKRVLFELFFTSTVL